MFWRWKTKELVDALYEVKKLKIKGVIFKIRKINVLDYLNGSQVLIAEYDTYKNKVEKEGKLDPVYEKKIKNHYRDVFMAGVVKPKLSRKDESDSINVDELFIDWDIANKLYEEIVKHTFGKKKVISPISADKS